MKKLYLDLRQKAEIVSLAQETAVNLDSTKLTEYFETLFDDESNFKKNVGDLYFLPKQIKGFSLECDEQGYYYHNLELGYDISLDFGNDDTVLNIIGCDEDGHPIDGYETSIEIDHTKELKLYKESIVEIVTGFIDRMEV